VDYSNNINAGTATAGYSYIGDGNHEPSSDSKTFEIGKASTVTVVTINGGPFTYTGLAQTPATVSVTGANLSLTPTVDYSNNINAGTATAGYSYIGDGNHEPSSDSKTFEIGKANAIVNIYGYTGIYDALPHGATGTAVGVGGETLTGLSLGSSFINFPGGTAHITFINANYENQSRDVIITINKAPLTVIADNKIKYCGQANPILTGTLIGVLGSDNITSSYTTTVTQASIVGTYSITSILNDPNNKLINYLPVYINGILNVNLITFNLTAISPSPINTPITLSAQVSGNIAGILIKFYIDGVELPKDPNNLDVTNELGIATITIPALAEQVYGVSAIAGNGCVISAPGFLPVYDPSRGFAVGNGSFDSSAGSYLTNTTCVAKARFGFSIKYKKGTTIPQGELDFQLKKAKMKFESISFQWLVISGNKTQFKGTGKINNLGTYNFTVTAIDNGICEMEDEHDGDGDDEHDHHNGYDRDDNRLGYHRDGKKCNDRRCSIPDQFRIVITTITGVVVYDNQIGMLQDGYAVSNITRGAIEVNDTKITKKNVAGNIIAPKAKATIFNLFAYPNPTNSQFVLVVEGGSNEKINVVIYDELGRMIKHIDNIDGQQIKFGEGLPSGSYIAIINQGINQKTVRLIKE
jgi:hypothetical protein